MSKKKKYILLLLITLVLAAITAGIYLFVNPSTSTSSSYTVDKYTDITSWCDASVKDDTLSVDCKALLINIDPQENGSSCFDIQVITKEKELKDLTVCESGDTLTYTNDVLGYKKLMPVDIVFTYIQEGVLGDYSFNNVSFSKVDNTYVQNIVNEDIANLVTTDPSTTTIQNSVDFCPRPETLPDYVEENNKTAYTEFYNNNILDSSLYDKGYLYSIDDTTIRLLYTCDSKATAGYIYQCSNISNESTTIVADAMKYFPKDPVWGKEMDEENLTVLKQISLLYDGTKLIDIKNESDLVVDILSMVSSNTSLSEEVYCGTYKLIEQIYPQIGQSYLAYMKDYLQKNIQNITSITCTDIFDREITDNIGLYIQNVSTNLSNDNLQIMNRCKNLNDMLNY